MTRFVLLAAGLAVVAALVAAAAWTGDDDSEKPAEPTRPSGSAGRSGSPSSDLSATAEAIAAFCRERFPDAFAGVAVDESAGRVIVYRRPVDEGFDEAVAAEFRAVRVAFRDAPASERDLRALTQRILREADSWRERGIEIQGVGPDPVRGVVVVITPAAEDARRELRARYGDRVVVREGAVAHPPTTAPSSASIP